MAGKTLSFNTFQMKLRQLIELNLQTFNCAFFPVVAVSLDGKMANVCVCIPISTPTLSGISQFFSGKKVTAPPSPKVPVRLCYRSLRRSKNQLEVSRLKVFLKAFFKSYIGFFSTKVQTGTTDSKCVRSIYLIVDHCIQWEDYTITIDLSFKLSFTTRSNREGRNKSTIHCILSVELLSSLRPAKQSSVAPLSTSALF